MLNQITLMGRLTRDPDTKMVNNVPVATFSLAVDRDYADKDGTRPTDFIDCVAWRSTAEFVNEYFRKGSAAIVCGRLQIRPWEDKEGNTRRATEVIVNSIYFGESKKKDEKPTTGEYKRKYR